MVTKYFVHAQWDEEGKCWYVSDTNIPGLFAEADNLETFQRELDELVPALLELNSPPPNDFFVSFSHQKYFKHAS